jgi:hypothetical protein
MLMPSLTATVLSRVHAGPHATYGSGVARDPITRLRTAIDCLPAETRRAMLEGVAAHPIVAGAYTDGRGGVCPMLAAHRHGGRTSFPSFARAWDAFTRTERVRRVTPRELHVLTTLLQESLQAEETDFAAAIAEHRESVARRELARPVIRVRRLSPARRRAGAARAARTAW